MAVKKWLLNDASNGVFVSDFEAGSADVPGTPNGWKIVKRVLRGGLSDGVEVIELDNGRLSVSVLPTRGMGVSHAEMGGATLGWKSPIQGPVNPRFVPLNESSGVGWLDGFTELMCRCGLESNGFPVFDDQHRLVYPLHGRIANLPASYVEVSVDEIAGKILVRGVVEEVRFHFQKLRLTSTLSTDFNSQSFEWEDRVENLSDSPAKMQMLYHINIGRPLLENGARLIAPIKAIAPWNNVAAKVGMDRWHTYDSPQAGFTEQCFLIDVAADPDDATQVLLKNCAGDAGVSVHFNKRDLPCFTQWRNTTSEADGYVTGLEPATNFPNPRPFEEGHNRLVRLEPRESWNTSVRIDWHTTTKDVEKSQSAIDAIQRNVKPVLHPQPLPEWSDL